MFRSNTSRMIVAAMMGAFIALGTSRLAIAPSSARAAVESHTTYKVASTPMMNDDEHEKMLNDMSAQGWELHAAIYQSPGMTFIFKKRPS